MNYYYHNQSSVDKARMYSHPLSAPSMPGTSPLGYPQQTGLPPSGPAGLASAQHAGLTTGAPGYGSAVAASSYPVTTSAYGTSYSGSPYANPAAMYQASLAYPQPTLAQTSPYLGSSTAAAMQGMRVPTTSTGFPGGNGLYGYSNLAAPSMSSPMYCSPSISPYPATAMPGTFGSYPAASATGQPLITPHPQPGYPGASM